MLEKTLELDGKLTIDSYNRLRQNSKDYIRRQVNRQHIDKAYNEQYKQSDDKIRKEEIDDFFQKSSVDMEIDANLMTRNTQDEIAKQKFFKGSKIVSGKANDSRVIKRNYELCNVYTWISKKEDSIKLSYLSLTKLKEKMERYDKEHYGTKIEDIQSKIDELKQSNPDIDFDSYHKPDGKLTKDSLKLIDRYEYGKSKAKILKNFIQEQQNITNHEDYNKLSDEEKKDYLLNSIIAVKLGDKDMTKVIGRYTARRFEIASLGENGLISLVQNEAGEYVPKINEENILNEYNKYSSNKFKNYQELVRYSEIKKMEYVSSKLEKYSELDEKSFFELKGKSPKEQSAEIEEIKMRSYYNNQKDEGSIKQNEKVSSYGNELNGNYKTYINGNQIQGAYNQSNITKGEEAENFLDDTYKGENGQNEIGFRKEGQNEFESEREETALVAVEKSQSFFDKIKNMFSKISEKVKETFKSNPKDAEEKHSNKKTNYSEYENDSPAFKKVSVNVLDAVQSTQINQRETAQKQENGIEYGD